jgi:hypothetical protein
MNVYIGNGFHAFALVALLAGAFVSPAGANMVALKRNAILTHIDPQGTGNSDASVLHVSFQALGSGDVVTTTVKDAFLYDANPTAGHPWRNYGVTTALLSPYTLFEFNLAVAPGLIGGTVSRAELRFYFPSGNTVYQAGRVLTAWSEGNKDGGYPGAAPAAPGASKYHPNGLNTGNTTPGTWQSGTFSATGATGDTGSGLDGDMARSRKAGTNNRWMVYDVTDILQNWVGGSSANLGFWLRNNNYVINSSEAGTGQQPVLFIDYAPKLPKGTVILVR